MDPQVAVQILDANARRLVACWNFCEGLSTLGLEELTAQDILQLLEDDANNGVSRAEELLTILKGKKKDND